ncbi:MAG: TetR/AcrR family transcriptional regulator [Acidimicrobiales bacterium]
MSESRSASGEATRQALIRAAEQLFAAQGVDGTTIAAITVAAGQRNNYAVGWHFGGKAELVGAVLQKHQQRIDRVRCIVLDAIEAAGSPDIRAVAHGFVAPLADRLSDPDGGADYLRIQAELLGRRGPETDFVGPGTRRLLAMSDQVIARGEPEALADMQALIVGLVFHGLADFAARRPDADAAARASFERLLVDTVTQVMEGHNQRSRGRTGDQPW